MGSVLAAGTVHDAVLSRVREFLTGILVEISPAGMRGPVTVYDGVAKQQPAYPFVLVETTGERPYDTLGTASGAKFGGSVRVTLRVIAQYPTTVTQTYRIANLLKGALDRQPLAVSGFSTVDVTWESSTLLTDQIGGVPTWELVSILDVFVHQS